MPATDVDSSCHQSTDRVMERLAREAKKVKEGKPKLSPRKVATQANPAKTKKRQDQQGSSLSPSASPGKSRALNTSRKASLQQLAPSEAKAGAKKSWQQHAGGAQTPRTPDISFKKTKSTHNVEKPKGGKQLEKRASTRQVKNAVQKKCTEMFQENMEKFVVDDTPIGQSMEIKE